MHRALRCSALDIADVPSTTVTAPHPDDGVGNAGFEVVTRMAINFWNMTPCFLHYTAISEEVLYLSSRELRARKRTATASFSETLVNIY
jgi:hypothetical protein